MSKELKIQEEISPEIINSLILTGDMSKLTAGQQTQYYNAVCKSVGVNPLTQPFAIIVLQGKKILYATKGCTQQLAANRGINTEIREEKTIESVYKVSCRATLKDGMFTDDIGVVSIVGLKGSELGNAMMKAVTKSKRRAVLALCGLGMPDESEIEDIQQHPASEIKPESGKSRVESLIDNQVEEAVTTPVKEEVKNDAATVKYEGKKEGTKKENKVKNTSSNPSIEGVIEGQPRSGVVDGKTKYLFKIKDKEFGTFDEKIVKEVMEVVDMQQKRPKNQYLVQFIYKERPSEKTPGKIFFDIVSFKKISTDDVENFNPEIEVPI